MLFWGVVILVAVFAILWFIGYLTRVENLQAVGAIVSLLLCIPVVFMSLIIGCIHISSDARLDKLQQTRNALQYQFVNDMYNNNNDRGKLELFEKIQEWNENLAVNKQYQDNFWIGIFVPNIYDELELIELK